MTLFNSNKQRFYYRRYKKYRITVLINLRKSILKKKKLKCLKRRSRLILISISFLIIITFSLIFNQLENDNLVYFSNLNDTNIIETVIPNLNQNSNQLLLTCNSNSNSNSIKKEIHLDKKISENKDNHTDKDKDKDKKLSSTKKSANKFIRRFKKLFQKKKSRYFDDERLQRYKKKRIDPRRIPLEKRENTLSNLKEEFSKLDIITVASLKYADKIEMKHQKDVSLTNKIYLLDACFLFYYKKFN